MQTVVPAQALALLNSPLAREQADAFACRLVLACGADREKAIASAFLRAFGRQVGPEEARHVGSFLETRKAALGGRRGESPARSPEEAALAEFCLALFNATEFITVD